MITTLKYINTYINNDSIVADFGAGTGIYTLEIADNAKSVYAVDLVQKHVDEISKKVMEINRQNITAFFGSATDLHEL